MPTRSVRPPVRARLSVESLEDRLAPATFTVTNTNDAGAGSLRAAISSANAAVGTDTVAFAIGSGLQTINLLSALPAISGQVIIAGQTQPGFAGTPIIELNGTGAGAGVHGVVVSPGAAGSAIKGLIINRFEGDGVRIRSNNCVVATCFIGTNSAGTIDLGNGESGVAVSGAAAGNRIGGTAAAQRNLISGNGLFGVSLSGAGVAGTLIQGNFIGTAVTGLTALPNFEGVRIFAGAHGNVVGGTTAGARNVISGNNSPGVMIFGAGTNGNQIQGNFIGTIASGTAALENSVGVFIQTGASGNVIGGTTSGARNVISGNAIFGLAISSAGTEGNKIQGNFIGTNAAGTADLGNVGEGVVIMQGADNNVIGGTTAGARNIVSGNGAGVQIQGTGTTGNRVVGNFIGTDVTGAVDLGNSSDGVSLTSGASGNFVGGTAPGSRNVISGNGADGVEIVGDGTTGNTVQGNFIGTDAAGTADLGNSLEGIQILFGASRNLIGGTTASARNVIAGNNGSGVRIEAAGTNGNKVKGNFIGTDRGGNADLGNTASGVVILFAASGNVIGGAVAGARNIISGNNGSGVRMEGTGTSGNSVKGNFIGTDRSGNVDLGNSANGVFISSGSSDNVIGGTFAGARNVISGNDGNGVMIGELGTTGNAVLGNRIGLAATSGAALGNTFAGVSIITSASGNVVGGTVAGAGNVIANNGGQGVWIQAGSGNSVARNRIFDNGDLGIDLGSSGVAANDLNDADLGANNLLNFPVLITAARTTGRAANRRVDEHRAEHDDPHRVLREPHRGHQRQRRGKEVPRLRHSVDGSHQHRQLQQDAGRARCAVRPVHHRHGHRRAGQHLGVLPCPRRGVTSASGRGEHFVCESPQLLFWAANRV